MIESIDKQRVVVRCAICEALRGLAFRDLQVRTLDPTTAMVALPACPCGAVEFLIRATRPEHPQPGSEGHRHQVLVAHLHAELVLAKRVVADSKDAATVCPPVPAEELARWFPAGLSRVGEDVEVPA